MPRPALQGMISCQTGHIESVRLLYIMEFRRASESWPMGCFTQGTKLFSIELPFCLEPVCKSNGSHRWKHGIHVWPSEVVFALGSGEERV